MSKKSKRKKRHQGPGHSGSIECLSRAFLVLFNASNYDWDHVRYNATRRGICQACLVAHVLIINRVIKEYDLNPDKAIPFGMTLTLCD